jgi:hypothetical protein
MRLDLAVWEVRRYAHVIDYYVATPKGVVGLLQHELQRLENAENRPHGYRIMGGVLESIIAKPDHPSREPLLWQNAFFGTRHRRAVRLAAHFNAANSPLSLHPEILEDVLKFVYLPPDVVQEYRRLAEEEGKESVNEQR